MKQKRSWLVAGGGVALLIVLLAVFLPRGTTPVKSNENLLVNGGFDSLDSEGMPEGWYVDSYVNTPGYTRYDTGEGLDGTAAHIKSNAGNDARFAQMVSVNPNSLYLLHGYIKANATGGVGANLSVEGVYVFSNSVYDTDEGWDEVSLYGRTGEDQTRLTVFARLGGYSGEAQGEAYFDNLSLTEVSSVPAGFMAYDLFTSDTPDEKETTKSERTGAFLLVLAALLYLTLCAYCIFGRAGKKAMTRKTFWLLAGAMLVLSLLVRVVAALLIPGYDVDIGCFTAWSNRMVEVGPANFYAQNYFSDYPPGYMLVLWVCGAVGKLFSTGATEFIVKLPSILCDLLGAVFLMRFAARKGGENKQPAYLLSLSLGLLYLLNPLVILSGAGWGQSDSVMTLFLLLTVLFALEGKWRYALPAYLLSVLMKPQALMFGPLGLLALVLSFVASWKDKDALKKITRETLFGLLALLLLFAAVVVPFSISKGGLSWLFELYANTMNSYGFASVNACNLYFLFGCNWQDAHTAVPRLLPLVMALMLFLPALLLYAKKSTDKKTRWLLLGVMVSAALMAVLGAVFSPSFAQLGTGMIVLSLLIVFACFILRQDIKNLPLLGATLLILLFNTGSMMHERYLFPALLLLLVAYLLKRDARILVLMAGVTVSLLFNVGCVLDRNIRIGGSAAHLTAPIYGLTSDMAGLEFISGGLNVLLCGFSLYLCLLLTSQNVKLYQPALRAEAESAGNARPISLEDEKSASVRHLDKKDWIILLSVTALYLVGALWQLGSTKAPQTDYVFESATEEITYDLGKNYDDFRMLYYGGIHYYDSSFTVQTSEDGETFSEPYSCEMKEGTCFQWKYVKSYQDTDTRALSGRYVRLTADHIGLTLFETLFVDKELNPLPVVSATDSLSRDISALIDEPDSLVGEPGWFNSMYFDEIYHARTAYEHLHGISPYETTHPPLGKVIMSWCVALFGMTPFGWRFAGAMCGVLMLPGMYALGRLLFKKRRYAVLSMLLMTFDTMHYTQTRLATIDSFVVLFIIWSVYFMLRWFFEPFFGRKLWKSLVPLSLSGLFMGLAVASKWTGCYAGVGLAIVFFFGIARRAQAVKQAKQTDAADEITACAAQKGTKRLLITVLSCLIFFVLIPGVIYYLSYIPYFAPGGGVSLERIVAAAQGMLNYHATPGLGMDHPFYSPWYEWPVSATPMYYAADSYEPAGYASSILAFGNIGVWWVGLLCLLMTIYAFVRHQALPVLTGAQRGDKNHLLAPAGQRDVRPALLLICFAAQYLPWTLVPRGTYIYHYFPSIPFLILSIALIMEYLSEFYVRFRVLRLSKQLSSMEIPNEDAAEKIALTQKRADKTALTVLIVYIVLVGLLFAAFFPYASGLMVKTGWLDAMNWFRGLFHGWLYY